nr:hypothetical protein [Escherichia coli]
MLINACNAPHISTQSNEDSQRCSCLTSHDALTYSVYTNS